MGTERNRLHVVVTCSNRKRSATDFVSLHEVRREGDSQRQVLARWKKSLERKRLSRLAARQLYQGEHWSKVLDLESAARETGFRPKIWVCSAGYGLIAIDEPLVPYAATFAPGHDDSVCADAEEAQKWWQGLTDWQLGNGPRSLKDLVEAEPGARFLFILSGTYLQAVEDDLADALCASKKQARCVILSGAPSKNPSLVRNLINLDSKLLHTLGGTRGSLATRVADWVVRNCEPREFSESKIRESIDALTAKQPARKVYNRQPLSDEEVQDFIRRQRAEDKSLKASRALRLLRDQGQACEQKRFGALFREIVDGEKKSVQHSLPF